MLWEEKTTCLCQVTQEAISISDPRGQVDNTVPGRETPSPDGSIHHLLLHQCQYLQQDCSQLCVLPLIFSIVSSKMTFSIHGIYNLFLKSNTNALTLTQLVFIGKTQNVKSLEWKFIQNNNVFYQIDFVLMFLQGWIGYQLWL
jgi:hypothetical protein